MARKPLTKAAEAPSAASADARVIGLRPGKIAVYDLSADPFFFPPAADFNSGGRFELRVPYGAEVYLRTELDGPAYILDEGHWPIVTDGVDELLLSAKSKATIRVMKCR